MFPATITIHNIAQLTAVMAALSGEPSPQQSLPLAEPAKPTKAKAEPKAEKLTATQTAAMDDTAGLEKTAGNAQPAATAATEPTASAAKADAPAQKAVTYAELQAAVLRLHKADSTAAKPIAEGMGFANFKAMPEEKWADALKLVEAKLVEVV
jgi:hypothetical protein